MIIKSMSRKSTSFSQLYEYLTRDKSSFTFSRNTYANSKDKKEFVNEFYDNSRHLRDARGKVYMYHEVLSLEANELSLEKQKEILLDMADKYLYQRAENHLAFGVVHEDKNNMHLHLMISANEIEGDKRVRLSKQEFSQIQQRLENYKNQKYQELKQSSFYQDKKDLSKEKQNEQELKNRGAKSIKEVLKDNLRDTFNKATSSIYIENHLKSLGYEIYTRGNTQGITYKDKNYRFKTLGLEKEYQQLLRKLERIQERELRRQQVKDDRGYSRER
ncbi:MAG: relaxase/mobilization nuclease domain-containing protein [Campylobacterales bacterium]|nr:relaxase/mobilization nuclease domain-containing protein [Campylobacterales bacterium]